MRVVNWLLAQKSAQKPLQHDCQRRVRVVERLLPQIPRGTNGHSRGNRQACSPSFDLLRFMSLIATLGLCLIDASFPLIRRPRPMCCLV